RDATPILKGAHMAAQEALQHLVKKELEVKGAGVRKRRNEAGEPTLGTADFHRSEMRPVDLSLITRKGARAQKSFAVTGAQVSNSAPERIDTAWAMRLASCSSMSLRRRSVVMASRKSRCASSY